MILSDNETKVDLLNNEAIAKTIDKIKQDRNRALFYIHKPGPLPQDDEYLRELADTYIRGLLEVDAFIQDNLAQEDENNDL